MLVLPKNCLVFWREKKSLYESFEFGQKNWCTNVKEILNEMETTEICNKQCITVWKLKPSVVSYMKLHYEHFK